MARINLLPWREQLRREKQRQFGFIAVGSVVLMALVVLYVHLHIDAIIEYQQSRNEHLKNEIRAVEARIKEIEELEKKKQQLIARMQVIEQLQSNRPEAVHLLEELVKAVPEGLYLAAFRQDGKTLTIEGKAESNARVSSFMRSLDASSWLAGPKLEYIQTEGSEKTRAFRMTVTQDSPQKAPAAKQATAKK